MLVLLFIMYVYNQLSHMFAEFVVVVRQLESRATSQAAPSGANIVVKVGPVVVIVLKYVPLHIRISSAASVSIHGFRTD